jgi:polysaccharide deacetylase 2 family uncharacterized protein YibQ
MFLQYKIMENDIKLRKKGKNVLIRLPVETAKKFEEEADRLGLSLSSYLRMLVFKQKEANHAAA